MSPCGSFCCTVFELTSFHTHLYLTSQLTVLLPEYSNANSAQKAIIRSDMGKVRVAKLRVGILGVEV